MSKLYWQSAVYIGASTMSCLESYDSILERIRDGEMKQAKDGDGMRWLPPIELTVRGPGDRPLRAFFQQHAIIGVAEVPEDDREELVTW